MVEEMKRRNWSTEKNNEWLRSCYMGTDNHGFAMYKMPTFTHLLHRVSLPPVFSPFVDLAVKEAFALCEPHLERMVNVLKKGKYKWRRHKLFQTFFTSMHILQTITAPEEECFKISALITYKEITRQLKLSGSALVQYYYRNEIDSPRARDLKLQEAYALVEFLQATNQMKQALVTGKIERAGQLEEIFRIQMRAVVELKETIDEASHVRIIGLEPAKDYDRSGNMQQLELVDSSSLCAPVLTKRLPVFNQSNAPIVTKTHPAVSAKTTSAPGSSEKGSSRVKIESTASQIKESVKPVKVTNGSTEDSKKVTHGDAEKENDPNAGEGRKGSQPEIGHRKTQKKDNLRATRIACGESISSLSEKQCNNHNLPFKDPKECNPSAPSFVAEVQLPTDKTAPSVDAIASATFDAGRGIMLELMAEMQKEVAALRAKNEKVVANLRHKKSLLQQAETNNAKLQDEMRYQEMKLHDQIASLRGAIENVTASRDNLKNKLRIEKELLKQVRSEKDDLRRQLKQSEKTRAMERELLNLYRELSLHTGFHGLGKRIRPLEARLSEQQSSSGN